MNRRGIALVLSGFPRRTETFALNELLALAERGLLAAIFATKPGDGHPPQPGVECLLPFLHYLPAGDPAEQATALIRYLDQRRVHGIHAYFAHQPAAVAEAAARRLQVPFGFSTHAKDARKVEPTELGRRARAATCVVACNPDVAAELTAAGGTVHLLPHGVDTTRFAPQPWPAERPLRLLAVGRLVEKKGFAHLIKAVTQLQTSFHLRIIGDGPEQPQLQQQIEQAKLTEQVELCTSLTHAELPAAYAAAHGVVVPSVVDRSGDRDGLPNVLLEAMASGRAIIASDVGAVRSAITHEVDGLLLPPGDEAALTQAITQLAERPVARQRLAHNARLQVEERFDLRACSMRFCDFLEKAYGVGNSAAQLTHHPQ